MAGDDPEQPSSNRFFQSIDGRDRIALHLAGGSVAQSNAPVFTQSALRKDHQSLARPFST